MRKLFTTTLLLLIVGGGSFLTLSANQSDGPAGANHLPLSNLVIRSDGSHEAYTLQPLPLQNATDYTLVIGYSFLGQHAMYPDYAVIRIRDSQGNVQDYNVVDDYTRDRVYVEFVASGEWIHIDRLPADPDGYDIILYQGTYQDFPGFEPYLQAGEQRDHEGVLIMDYDHLLSAHDIMSLIQAKDPFGLVLTLSTTVDQYTPSDKKPGIYQMVFVASYGNINKTFSLEIRVYDLQPPVIDIPNPVIIAFSERLTLHEILQTLDVSDNVDDISYLDLEVLSDTYSSATTIGHYQIEVQAVDSSGNTTNRIIPIQLVDLHGPVIEGPSAIFVYTEDDPLTLADILMRFDIDDDVDGSNVTITVIEDQYQQTRIPGMYFYTIRATDQQHNLTDKRFVIHVVNNSGPVFEIDGLILSVEAFEAMSEEDLIEWFRNQLSSQGHHATLLSIVYNEYQHHAGTPGTYYVYLNYDLDGQTHTTRIAVLVEEQPTVIDTQHLVIGGVAALSIGIVIVLKSRKPKMNP